MPPVCLPTPCRVRLLATCRRLYALHDTSVCLWGDAALHLASPRQAAQLAAALAAARPTARRLALGQAPSAARGCSQEQAAATAALACALGGLGATLESLAWAPGADPGAALAASWAPGCLPQLRSLTLLTRGPLTLPAALGAALPTLRELCIIERPARPSAPFFLGGPAAGALAAGSSELALEPGCLPEGLLRLELSAAGLLALPGALARATALTALRFDNGGAPCSLGGLSALRALRRLALPDAWPTPGALEEVGRLPALECLELPCSGGGHGAAGVVGGVGLGAVAAHHAAEVAEVLQGMAALEGLTELQLGGWELEAVPAELLTMPSLRVRAAACVSRIAPCPAAATGKQLGCAGGMVLPGADRLQCVRHSCAWRPAQSYSGSHVWYGTPHHPTPRPLTGPLAPWPLTLCRPYTLRPTPACAWYPCPSWAPTASSQPSPWTPRPRSTPCLRSAACRASRPSASATCAAGACPGGTARWGACGPRCRRAAAPPCSACGPGRAPPRRSRRRGPPGWEGWWRLGSDVLGGWE